MIYLDNAGTTKLSKRAKEAMMPFLEEEYGNSSSLHTLGQRAKEYLEEARSKIAHCINAEPNEIYFTSGGTESDNWAINSACEYGRLTGKNHIITTKIEHHAVLHCVENLAKRGFEVTYLPVSRDGVINVEDVVNAITDKTCLVSVMFANNEIGTIQPIKEIAQICQSKKIIFHTDAVQAVGHLKIDVKDLQVNMLSISSHKFHGPKGIGALFVKRGTPLFNFIYGGAQENTRRGGTSNVAGAVGMATALEEATAEMEKVAKHEIELRDLLFEELSKIPHSCINGSIEKRLPNNFNMCFEGIEGESLLLLLNEKGICVSSGSACTSGSLDPSHVLLAIGLPHDVAHGSLRISLSKFNTKDEILTTIEAVKSVVEYLRKISPVWDNLVKGVISHVI